MRSGLLTSNPVRPNKAISKLWGFFTLTLLTLCVLFWFRNRGGSPKDSLGLLDFKPTTVASTALPVEIVLTGIVLWMTLIWSRRNRDRGWACRLPVFYFDEVDVDVNSFGGKTYQVISLILTLVLPFILTVHMTAEFFHGTVYVNCDCKNHPGAAIKCAAYCDKSELVSEWGHFDVPRISRADDASDGKLRYGEFEGPSYYAWMPWVYSFLGIVVVFMWLFALWAIFRPRRLVSSDASRAPPEGIIDI